MAPWDGSVACSSGLILNSTVFCPLSSADSLMSALSVFGESSMQVWLEYSPWRLKLTRRVSSLLSMVRTISSMESADP